MCFLLEGAYLFLFHHADESKVCLKQKGSSSLGIADIDSKHKDPLMCSLYAPDIYSNLHAMEVSMTGAFLLLLQKLLMHC